MAACTGDAVRLDEGPCPCLPRYTCCATLGQCLPEGSPACPPPPIRLERVTPASGPFEGGTRITIEGEGLPRDVAVTVGAAACRDVTPAAGAGDRRLDCTTPPGPATGARVDVRVGDRAAAGAGAGGPERAAILSGAFTYRKPALSDASARSGLEARWTGDGASAFDADGDGTLDVFLSNAAAGSPSLVFGRGGLAFEAAGELGFGPSVEGLPADFDGDGVLDLLVVSTPEAAAGAGPGPAVIHLGLGAGSRGRFRAAAQPGLHPAPIGAAAIADVDGDGDPDAITCRASTSAAVEVRVAVNTAGVLVEGAPVPTPAGGSGECLAIASGDLDGDGDEDFVSCGTHVRAFAAEGRALLDVTAALGLPAAPFPAETPCTAVDAVDHDADGDLDLALHFRSYTYANASPRTRHGVVIFENLRSPAGGVSFRPALDLDRDVEPDPFCATQASLVAEAGLGAGTFSGAWLDADHDGDLDLLEPAPFGICAKPPVLFERHERHERDGRGGFDGRFVAISGVLVDTTGAIASDLDGDGDLDVLVHHAGRGRLAVLENGVDGERPSLLVRAVRKGAALGGVTIEVDLDGPPGAPDFAPGPKKLLVRAVGSAGLRSFSGFDAHFGLGGAGAGAGDLHARVRSGGRAVVRSIPAGIRRLELELP